MLMVEIVLRNPKMAIAILALKAKALTLESCLETSPQTVQAKKVHARRRGSVAPRSADS